MMGFPFVGADPHGLVGLADVADQYAMRLGLTRSELTFGPSRHADSAATALAEIQTDLGEEAKQLRWRATAIEQAQQVAIPFLIRGRAEANDRAEFAASAVFELASWEEAYRNWWASPTANELLKMDAVEVARTFATMAPSVAASLVRRHPRLIGRLDGAPAESRYLANDLLLEAEIERLRYQIAVLRDPLSRADLEALGFRSDGGGAIQRELIEMVSTALETRAVEYRTWIAEDRQILLFDTSGDGRVVEVFGDLGGATHVGVVIPGMANSLENFSTGEGGFRDNAAHLYEASAPGVATIAWLGYDTPDNIGAATRTAAEQGAPSLIRFLKGIDPGADKTVTVVAHSYGSVLAGTAARSGIAANNLVFVGSPGTTLQHASDAVLRSDGMLWSGLADDDPIALGIAPRELPTWLLIPNPFVYVTGIWTSFNDPIDLWHGANPAEAEFGALRIDTTGSSGHSSYFEASSLDNLVSIVEGNYASVELSD